MEPNPRRIPPFGLALIFSGIFLLIAWAILFFGFHVAGGPSKNAPITDLSANQIPSALPQDVVIEKDAQIIHSYVAAMSGGKSQATIIYSTNTALATVVIEYEKYFANGGWTVFIPASSGSNNTTITAKKGTTSLSVQISEKGTNASLVSVNSVQ